MSRLKVKLQAANTGQFLFEFFNEITDGCSGVAAESNFSFSEGCNCGSSHSGSNTRDLV